MARHKRYDSWKTVWFQDQIAGTLNKGYSGSSVGVCLPPVADLADRETVCRRLSPLKAPSSPLQKDCG